MTTKPTPLLTTEGALADWVGRAFPGDVLQYHRGFLAVDASPVLSRLPERDRSELSRIADCALAAAAEGFADLLQRSHGIDDYSYLIIARRRARIGNRTHVGAVSSPARVVGVSQGVR